MALSPITCQGLQKRYILPVVQSGLKPSPLERRQAIEALLASETFRRSDQLKRLLSYLYEQAEIGRIHEVTEYELGTIVLGRPVGFSPDTDSSVRTRMHGLRQKLEEYYRDGTCGSALRLEIPKGSYRPQFSIASMEVVVLPPSRHHWVVYAAMLALLGVGLFFFLRTRATNPLETLWQPVLASPQPPVLLVAQPIHIWVRDVQGQAEPLDYRHFPDPVPSSPQFLTYITPRLRENAKRVLHASPNATLWGDAAGAAGAARFLAFRHVSSEFLPESALKGEVSLRGRAVLAFGRPEYSPAIKRYLLSTGGYTVGMLNEIRHYSIYRPADPKDRFLNTFPPNEVNHGLITVLKDGPARVFVFSGITSDGTMAGLDYFTNEESVAQLWRLLEKEGHAEWPQAFQVVLRVTSSSGYAMAAKYEKHLVLQK